MPPRFVYWTIIAGGLPTAFRAAEREDLLPTFRRIREKHPDAELKWFARGKLWESKDAADRERDERRARTQERFGGQKPPARDGDRKPASTGADGRPAFPPGDGRPRPLPVDGAKDAPSGSRGSGVRKPGGARPRDWRPGGEHRDPRQKFKDAKKARNQDRRQERFARKQGDDRPRVERPPAGRPPAERSRSERPPAERPKANRPPSARPRFDRPRSDRPPLDRPKGSVPGAGRPLPTRPLQAQPSRPGGFKTARPGGWKNRPPGPESRARDRRFDDRGGKGPDKDKRRK
jgi:23S rRNA pseudouridine2605 synthase